jgi:hypothetical protein
MQIIKNQNQLEDFSAILDEFESLESDQYSSIELMNAASNLMAIAKGSIAKKKVTDRSWSDERWIVDTFTMMTEQPRTLTLNCFDDFQCLEDCTYSEFAKQQHVKEFLEG